MNDTTRITNDTASAALVNASDNAFAVLKSAIVAEDVARATYNAIADASDDAYYALNSARVTYESLVAASDNAFAVLKSARAAYADAKSTYDAALAAATKADEQAPDLWDEILPGHTHIPPSMRVTCPQPRETYTVVCPIANDNHEIIGYASYDYQPVSQFN